MLGAFGAAPSPGTMTFNTGISSGPSTNPAQMSQLNSFFSGLGQGAGAPKAWSPSLASGSQIGGNAPQQQAANSAMQMLQRQQGGQLGNQFKNSVNQQESQLFGNQAQAQSQAGLGMENLLGNQYSDYLGRLGQGNEAVVGNQIKTQQLLAGLMGSILGGATGLATSSMGALGGLGGGLVPNAVAISSGQFTI